MSTESSANSTYNREIVGALTLIGAGSAEATRYAWVKGHLVDKDCPQEPISQSYDAGYNLPHFLDTLTLGPLRRGESFMSTSMLSSGEYHTAQQQEQAISDCYQNHGILREGEPGLVGLVLGVGLTLAALSIRLSRNHRFI